MLNSRYSSCSFHRQKFFPVSLRVSHSLLLFLARLTVNPLRYSLATKAWESIFLTGFVHLLSFVKWIFSLANSQPRKFDEERAHLLIANLFVGESSWSSWSTGLGVYELSQTNEAIMKFYVDNNEILFRIFLPSFTFFHSFFRFSFFPLSMSHTRMRTPEIQYRGVNIFK